MVQAGRILLSVGLICIVAASGSARVQRPPETRLQGRLQEDWRPQRGGSKIHHNADGSVATEALGSLVTVQYSFRAHTLEKSSWSQDTLGSPDFALEWNLNSGTRKMKYDGGVSLLISPTKLETAAHRGPQQILTGAHGGLLGDDRKFTGLVVTIGPKQKHLRIADWKKRRTVSISAVGMGEYDPVMTVEGCEETMEFGNRAGSWQTSPEFPPSSGLRLKVLDGNMVALDVDPAGGEMWRRCATIPVDHMPVGWASESYVGVIQTAEVWNRSTRLDARVRTIPNGVWETDADGEDEDDDRLFPREEDEEEHILSGVGLDTAIQLDIGVEPHKVSNPTRTSRILGIRSLKEACSDDADFTRCHHSRGSVPKLRRCLRQRGSEISDRCNQGIETWTTLLAQTAPGAPNKPRIRHRWASPADHDKLASLRDGGVTHHGTTNKPPPRRGDDTPLPLPSTWQRLPPGEQLQEDRRPPPDLKQKQKQTPPLRASHHDDKRYNNRRRRHGDDSPGDNGVGLIAVFTCIAASCAFVFFALYFFVLAIVTSVTRLVGWCERPRGGSGGNAPAGYSTLPGGNASSASATASVSGPQWFGSGRVGGGGGNDGVDDDDAVVVTGTPVNPPPSVHV